MKRGSGFFNNARGKRLFYSWVGPESASSAWIFCNPFLEEKIFTIDIYKKFADQLAERGQLVLRFDFEGDGDSEGYLTDISLAEWLQDIQSAKQFLHTQFSIDTVSLFGLRLGGTLACLAAPLIEAQQVLAWDPIADGNAYFQECLRLNLFLQMSTYRRVIEDRATLMEKLQQNQAVNIMGFEIGKTMADSISNCKLENTSHFHILKFSKKPQAPEQASRTIMIESFWHEPKTYNALQPELTRKSLEIVFGHKMVTA